MMKSNSENYIQELLLRDTLLEGISQATQLLISPRNFADSIQEALQVLAETVQVNRVYIFQNFTDNGVFYLHQAYEYARNVKPQLDNENLIKLAYHDGYSRWYDYLSEKKVICGNVEDFPEQERPLLEMQDIISILVVPIFIKNHFWGFIGFDDCEKRRVWIEAEKSILVTMAASFGNFFDRKKTAENLQAREELFRTLTEHLKSGVYTIDETGKFTYANPEVLLITGYSEDEFLKKNFLEIVHPAFLNNVKESAFSRLQGIDVPSSYEFIIVTKSGEERWIKVSNCRIFYKKRPYILGTAIDITEQKNAETALAKEKEQLAVTLSSIGDGVITTDRNGKVLLLNQAAELLTGWQQEEAYSKPISEVFHIVNEETKKSVPCPVEQVLKTNQTLTLSNHALLVKKNGDTIFIADCASPIHDENNRLEGVVLVFRNVTDEKKAGKIQETLLRIAVSVTTSKNLTELYERIHQELKLLIPAKNFYIALLRKELNLIQIPYFVDEVMTFATVSIEKSLVSKVINGRKSILLKEDQIQKMIDKNEIEWLDTIAKSWLGVPLIIANKTIGAVVVQDYKDKDVFNEDDERILQFISEHIALAIEKMQVEKQLTESEEKYRLLFETGSDSILLLENDVCIDCNQKASSMFKIEKEKMQGKSIFEFCIDDREAEKSHEKFEAIIDLAYDEKPQFVEWEVENHVGEKFSAEIYLNTLHWKNRIYLLAIIRDITERKEKEKHISDSLKEKETLLQEIHHRVKNNMQVISSMLNLQSSLIKNRKYSQMFQDSQNRVKTMALVHEKLYQTIDFSNIDFQVYLKDLVGYLFKSYQINSDLIKFVSQIEDISLDINTAIPCGLIVNELVTNSLKYAFPNKQSGKIELTLTQTDIGKCKMIFSDDGVGLPEKVDMEGTKTLGLYLIKILTIQINGEFIIERKNGTTFIIEFEYGSK